MTVVAMPGVPVSLDFSIITPEGYEMARQAWHNPVVAEKGGEGSGNFGHTGRPGKVGGSAKRSSSWPKYNSSGNTTVFHGTTKEFIDDIFEHGLQPGAKWMGRNPSVYFTVDKEEAIQWAETVASSGDWEIGLVEFSIPDDFDTEIVDDTIANRDFDWNTAFRVERDIPPEYIRAVYLIKTKFVAHDRGGPIPYDMVREVIGERHKERICYAVVLIEDDEIVAEKQLPIDDDSKANLIAIRTEIFNEEIDALVESMYTGEISIGKWEELMKKQIRELHSSVAAIGKGGWDQMTWADWGRLGPVVKEQYRYLHGFAEYISEKRDTISIEALKARAHMYGRAAGHSAYLIEAGQVISDALPWMPRDGSTQCLTNCMCEWQLEIVGKKKDFNIVQATWKLNPADHCDDCIERDGYVHVFDVYKDIPVPKTIGGY